MPNTKTTYIAVVVNDASLTHFGIYASAQERMEQTLEVLRTNYSLPELEDFTDATDPDEILRDVEQQLEIDNVDLHLTEEEVQMPVLTPTIHTLVIDGVRPRIKHTSTTVEMFRHLYDEIHALTRRDPLYLAPVSEVDTEAARLRDLAACIPELDPQVTYAGYFAATVQDGDSVIG